MWLDVCNCNVHLFQTPVQFLAGLCGYGYGYAAYAAALFFGFVTIRERWVSTRVGLVVSRCLSLRRFCSERGWLLRLGLLPWHDSDHHPVILVHPCSLFKVGASH